MVNKITFLNVHLLCTKHFLDCFFVLLPLQVFSSDGQHPRRHPRSPHICRDENFAVKKKFNFLEHSLQKIAEKYTKDCQTFLGVD